MVARDGLGPGCAPVGSARRVLGDRGSRVRVDRVGDAEHDPHSGSRIGGCNGVRGLLDVDAERGEARGGRVEVVGIGHADAELDEPPPRRVDEAELFAAVDGGESVAVEAGQAELFVVGGCLGDVRDADAD